MRDDTLALRALGLLLAYPDEELRENLHEIRDLLLGTGWFHRRLHAKLDILLNELADSEPLEAEARYLDLFERGRRSSLYLFEHAYGESRDRGPAMIALTELYEKANLHPSTRELPDFLPVLLEYLSCRDLAEARSLLREAEPSLRKIGETLQGKHSPYEVIFEALLELLRASPLSAPRGAITEPEMDHTELDAQWEEPPAFGKPGPDVIHFYPKQDRKGSEGRS